MPEKREYNKLCCHCLILCKGAVSGEMFRHMQNSEIIRKMTEEFDEVMQPVILPYFPIKQCVMQCCHQRSAQGESFIVAGIVGEP